MATYVSCRVISQTLHSIRLHCCSFPFTVFHSSWVFRQPPPLIRMSYLSSFSPLWFSRLIFGRPLLLLPSGLHSLILFGLLSIHMRTPPHTMWFNYPHTVLSLLVSRQPSCLIVLCILHLLSSLIHLSVLKPSLKNSQPFLFTFVSTTYITTGLITVFTALFYWLCLLSYFI